MRYKKLADMPVVSTLLVIINVIIFLICTFTGEMLYNMGGMDVISVLVRKEYARVLWAMFLHGDVNHLFNNMLILFFLGAMIEKEVGHIRYGVLYFLSGIGGNLLSLCRKVVVGSLTPSIGASGAVFGLDGMLLALVLFSERKLPNVTIGRVLLMIVYSLYSGYTGANVDNAAHVGGLLVGFLSGVILCMTDKIKESMRCHIEH